MGLGTWHWGPPAQPLLYLRPMLEIYRPSLRAAGAIAVLMAWVASLGWLGLRRLNTSEDSRLTSEASLRLAPGTVWYALNAGTTQIGNAGITLDTLSSRYRISETLVLEMGEQIRVLDLARNLIRLSGYVPDEEIPIVYTGLRPGEKLFEELAGESELMEPSPVDKILRIVSTSPVGRDTVEAQLAELEHYADNGDVEAVLVLLSRLAHGFRSSRSLQPA